MGTQHASAIIFAICGSEPPPPPPPPMFGFLFWGGGVNTLGAWMYDNASNEPIRLFLYGAGQTKRGSLEPPTPNNTQFPPLKHYTNRTIN